MTKSNFEIDMISAIRAAANGQDYDRAFALWQELWNSGCRDVYRWLEAASAFEGRGQDRRLFALLLPVVIEVGVANEWLLGCLARTAYAAELHDMSISLCEMVLQRPVSEPLRFHVARCLFHSYVAMKRPREAIGVFCNCFRWFFLASHGTLPIGLHEVEELCEEYGFTEYQESFEQGLIPDDFGGGQADIPPISVIEADEDAAIRALLTIPETEIDVVRPESLNGIWPLGDHFQNTTRNRIRLFALENARIIGKEGAHVVLTEKGDVVGDLSNFHANQITLQKLAEVDRTLLAEGKYVEMDQVVIIRDVFRTANICHFLLDHVTRLALLEMAGVDPRSVNIIGPDIHAGFQLEALDILGLTRAQFLSTDGIWSYRCKRLYVPDSTVSFSHPANLGDEWALQYLRRLRAAPAPAGGELPRKLYISRQKSTGRRIINDDKLWPLLQQHGFACIYAEDLSLREQIALFANATHIVAPHGAGLTNIVFCDPDTKILELFHPFYMTDAYFYVARSLGLDYRIACDETAQMSAYRPAVAYGMQDITAPLEEIQAWLEAG